MNFILKLLEASKITFPFRSFKSRYILKSILGDLEWRLTLFIYLSHFAISFAVLRLLGEEMTQSMSVFFYFYHTTVTTVGYGDYSPKSELGQIFTVVWVMFFGIVLFTAFIGEVISKYIQINNDLLKGKIHLMKASKHIVIFGNSKHSLRLIEHIRLDKNQSHRDIALVLPESENIPDMPKGTCVVAVKSFLDMDELNRLSLCNALSILIDTGNDGMSISLSLMIQQLLKQCPPEADRPNVLAYFDEYQMESIVEQSCPDIECFTLGRNKVLATAITDVGTIKVNEALNSPESGNATQYSKRLPDCAPEGITVRELRAALEESLNITIIGVETIDNDQRRSVLLNPQLGLVLKPNQRFFYIGSNRLNEKDVEVQLEATKND
ncbi:two pore domain potassium channel family protein [Vibrio vulnificus]|nr:two pore domain potassium channel family protein [Vibrio vulnificus]